MKRFGRSAGNNADVLCITKPHIKQNKTKTQQEDILWGFLQLKIQGQKVENELFFFT